MIDRSCSLCCIAACSVNPAPNRRIVGLGQTAYVNASNYCTSVAPCSFWQASIIFWQAWSASSPVKVRSPARSIIENMGMSVATPDEAREMLKLKNC